QTERRALGVGFVPLFHTLVLEVDLLDRHQVVVGDVLLRVEPGEVLRVGVEHGDRALDASALRLALVDAALGTVRLDAAQLVRLDQRRRLVLLEQEGQLEIVEQHLDELFVRHVDVDEVALVLAALAALATALTVTAGAPARFLATVDRNPDFSLVTKDGVVLDDVTEAILDLAAHAITEPVLVRRRAVTPGARRRVDDGAALARVRAGGP